MMLLIVYKIKCCDSFLVFQLNFFPKIIERYGINNLYKILEADTSKTTEK